RGLECGAEDYITKPFGVLEMQARVKTVLRRMKRSDTDDVQWGDLAFSFANKEVTQAGQPLQLTWKEYQLLECLCRHAGQTLSREQLLENVWGYRYEGDTTRTVDFHIAALRQKLGDQADRPRYIETVRGFGYRLKKDGTP
ncbi:MAG: response regulator transcription factor, partial [Clostridia bacterium]